MAPALEAIDEARRALPGVPHVAVFDTAFHATIPAEAFTYALPQRWREQWGIRRYGFHGLSVAWAAERVPVSRLVVCHLGGGCSVTAVLDGRSVDTTMGFSPLEGVPMATRPGSIDPEILLYLLRHEYLSADELEHALEHESGLLGLGGSARVEELETSPEPAARLALDVFAHQRRRRGRPRWPPRSAGSTRSSSPPGSARARRRCAATSALASASSASSSTPG